MRAPAEAHRRPGDAVERAKNPVALDPDGALLVAKPPRRPSTMETRFLWRATSGSSRPQGHIGGAFHAPDLHQPLLQRGEIELLNVQVDESGNAD